jgi:hypothetical protein
VALDGASARDGVARVAYAEAGNQGDSGLAAVVYTILNRLQDGRWGASIDTVLNARSQFEPVMRAGGDWRGLPPVSAAQRARIDTILNLALEGRLPDLTHGARFFQNPTIVERRARAGTVSAPLVNFGGQTPSAIIGAHSFYIGQDGEGGTRVHTGPGAGRQSSEFALFVGENRASTAGHGRVLGGPDLPAATFDPGDPSRALFVSRGGQISAAPR